MPQITANDLSLVYSGGTTNTDPNASLGGQPSGTEVPEGLSNVFDNTTPERALTGYTDYRCLYLFNDSENIYNVEIYLEKQLDNPAELSLGVFRQAAVQTINITQTVVGGNFILTIGGLNTPVILFDINPVTFGNNIKEALNSLVGYQGIEVSYSYSPSLLSYKVIFGNVNTISQVSNRAQELLGVAQNNLVLQAGGTPTINIVSDVDGGPINTTAPKITAANQIPSGVSFFVTSQDDTLKIGYLREDFGFPFWIRRVIPAKSDPSSLSGATLKIKGLV